MHQLVEQQVQTRLQRRVFGESAVDLPQARHARAVGEEIDAALPKRFACRDGGVIVRESTSQQDGQGSIVDVERVPQLAQADFIALGERDVSGLEAAPSAKVLACALQQHASSEPSSGARAAR